MSRHPYSTDLPRPPFRLRRRERPGLGGSSSYRAKAVHFDGLSRLVNGALVSSEDTTASLSFLFRGSVPVMGSPQTILAVDPGGSFNDYVVNYSDGIQFGFGTDFTVMWTTPLGLPVSPEVWHHILVSADVGRSPIMSAVYIDDVRVGEPAQSNDPPPTAILFNNLSLWLGSDNSGNAFIGDMADVWIAPGVSLLDGPGAIPPATRRKFTDGLGKPVFLGAAGELPTGTAPAVFLSGDHSTFPVNRGTGGTFTVTGALTDVTGPP